MIIIRTVNNLFLKKLEYLIIQYNKSTIVVVTISNIIIFPIMQDITKMLSLDFIQKAIDNPLQDEQCADMHGGTCNAKAINQFIMGCKSVYKMYLLVHLIPFIIFKRKKVVKNPKQQIKKLVTGMIKSLLFAGGYSFLIRRIVCWITQFYCYTEHCSTLSAVFAAGTLCFEPIGRQSQIALFCLNKSMQVTYNMLQRRNYPVHIPYGECVLNGVAMAIIGYVYVENSSTFRQNYKNFLDKLLGDI